MFVRAALELTRIVQPTRAGGLSAFDTLRARMGHPSMKDGQRNDFVEDPVPKSDWAYLCPNECPCRGGAAGALGWIGRPRDIGRGLSYARQWRSQHLYFAIAEERLETLLR